MIYFMNRPVWWLAVLLVASPLHAGPAWQMIQAKTELSGKWADHPTRTLADLPDLATNSEDFALDQYGGLSGRRLKATGFFYPAKLGDRWWLVDPAGGLFLKQGVASVCLSPGRESETALTEKFGDATNWATATTTLLRAHGFNSLGAWSDDGRLRQSPQPLAYTRMLNFMSGYGRKRGGTHPEPGHTGFPNGCIFVFDPAFETYCDEHARELSALKNDPWLLGYFSDNELPFTRDCLTNYLRLPETDAGHQAAADWLRAQGIDPARKEFTTAEQQDFLALVVGRYYRIVSAAIKRYDPNHLYLGSRFYGREVAEPEVFRAAGAYADVISVNYYHVWTPSREKFTQWEQASGRPILITEWYAKAMDVGLPNTGGAGWIVKTQRDRGAFYQNFALSLLATKVCVGWDWFKYADNDLAGSRLNAPPPDSNKGIVNSQYEPYTTLLEAMKALNERAYSLASYFDGSSSESAGQPRPKN